MKAETVPTDQARGESPEHHERHLDPGLNRRLEAPLQ
jgi:hypothetical protein